MPQDRRPFVNWLILVAVVATFVLQTASIAERRAELPAKIKESRNRSVQDVAEELGVNEQQLEKIEKSVEKTIESINHPHSGMLSVKSKDELVKRAMLERYFVWGKVMPFILKGWDIKGLLGHIWLHGGILHLLGNMLFLWIFGNAVCAKISNRFYLPVYLGLGIVAGMVHLLFKGGYVLGASGAINGIVGMYLVFFPENVITCYFVLWLFFHLYIKEFSVSSIWIILFWLVFDIWGAMSGGGGVAYFAHLGGFAGGVVLAILMLKFKLVVMEERYEKSLLQLLSGKGGPAEYESAPLYFSRSGITERDLELTTEPAPDEVAERPSIPLEPPTPIPLEPETPKEEFIHFTCSCGKRFKVPSEYAGKTGKCPKCKNRIKIPDK